MPQESPLRLEIDSHVIRQLGDELITDTGQALLELVKNSYDADAEYCQVEVETEHIESVHLPTLEGAETPPDDRHLRLKGKITVKDNGTGMSYEVIKRGWLTISLSPKRAFKLAGKVTARFGRTPLGDKGLGRIGTLKLGSYIVIETFENNADHGWRVSFSWNDCGQGNLLSSVPVSATSIPPRGIAGTTLYIYGLSDLSYWKDSRSITSLSRQLSTLISPFKSFNDFDISFVFDSVRIPLETAENYLSAAQARFSVTWLPSEDAERHSLEIEGFIKLLLFRKTRNDPGFRQYVEPDRGESLLSFFRTHRQTSSLALERGPGEWFIRFTRTLSGADLSTFVSDNRLENPGPFMGEVFDIDISEAKRFSKPQFVDSHTGVFIYRDNFRIRMGDDWLGLGERQTRGESFYGLRPGNTLGWMSIAAKENRSLVEKSDREGFVENSAKRGFEFLAKRFVQEVNDTISTCRRAYNDFIKGRKHAENARPTSYGQSDALSELQETADSAKEIAALLSDNTTFATDVIEVCGRLEASFTAGDSEETRRIVSDAKQIASVLASRAKGVPLLLKKVASIPHAVSTIVEEYSTDDRQMRELYSTAAVGLAAEGLVHEVNPVVEAMLYALSTLAKAAHVLGYKNVKFLSDIRSAEASGQEIVDRIRFLDPMLRNRRGHREQFEVASLITTLKKQKKAVWENDGTIFEVMETDLFQIRASRGRMLQVFDNLARNSHYWLQRAAGLNPGLRKTVTFEVKNPFILVWDNGTGIDERVASRIFDVFVSGKPEGEGHGLGLYISRELLALEKSTIELLPDRNQHGRQFKFEINLGGALK